jgi:hypothetical protein
MRSEPLPSWSALGGLAALLLLGCPAKEPDKPAGPLPLEEQLGRDDPRGLAVFQGFDRAQAGIIGYRTDEAEPVFGGGITVLKTPLHDVAAPLLAQLKSVLAGHDALDTRAPLVRCSFSPYVGVRLFKGSDAIDIALCFSCDQFMLTSSRLPQPANRYEMNSISGRFPSSRRPLLDWAIAEFPDDEALKAARAKR